MIPRLPCAMAVLIGLLFSLPQSTVSAQPIELLWSYGDGKAVTPHITISCPMEQEIRSPGDIRFTCSIESHNLYPVVTVQFRILHGEEALSSGELQLSLEQGANECSFLWNAAEGPLGDYTALIEVQYSVVLPPAVLRVPFRKVNTAQLTAELDAVVLRVEELRTRHGMRGKDAPATGDGMRGKDAPATSVQSPYLETRIRIAEDTLSKARQGAATEAWRDLDVQLEYLRNSVSRIEAGFLFAANVAELAAPAPVLDLRTMAIREGSFFTPEGSVFLFGSSIEDAEVERLERLAHFGFNFVVLQLGPEKVERYAPDGEALQAQLDTFFAAAERLNVDVIVQLAPSGAWPEALERWPNVMDKGFLDLDHPGVKQALSDHIGRVGGMLKGKTMLHGLSLGYVPRFKFDGEEKTEAFIAYVKELYPDSQDLNRAWRAHLAAHSEIKPWAANPDHDFAADGSVPFDPLSSYQNRRPYQFDWQMFHRGLGTGYFQWVKTVARAAAPDTPLMIALEADAFVPGETRYGVARDDVAKLFDASACTAAIASESPFYAMPYPDPGVHYTLMQSLDPTKPVAELELSLALPEGTNPEMAYRFAHCATWGAFLAGLDAQAVSAESPIFDNPYALEGLTTAMLDIQRLGAIVQAFQHDRAAIAVVYSESSKIFDNGVPHLESAHFAFEGSSFAGYPVRFVTEDQIAGGALDTLNVLVIPETPSVSDAAFAQMDAYIQDGGTVARTGTPIPYNEKGLSRHNVLPNTGNTVLVRGINLPTEYLHAMDAVIAMGALPSVPRTINGSGYPIEGVLSRFVEHDGKQYLYVVNMRKEPVRCRLAGDVSAGRDLIRGRSVSFPTDLEPLDPMLIQLDHALYERELTPLAKR